MTVIVSRGAHIDMPVSFILSHRVYKKNCAVMMIVGSFFSLGSRLDMWKELHHRKKGKSIVKRVSERANEREKKRRPSISVNCGSVNM
jgi:hypothetical protein